MLLYFAPCRPLARPHHRPRQNLPCLQYSVFVSFFILRIPKQQGASAAVLCAHSAPPPFAPPPDADADADADEAVTDALFFSPFLPVAFLPAPFSGTWC
jgi:hypothetical protein